VNHAYFRKRVSCELPHLFGLQFAHVRQLLCWTCLHCSQFKQCLVACSHSTDIDEVNFICWLITGKRWVGIIILLSCSLLFFLALPPQPWGEPDKFLVSLLSFSFCAKAHSTFYRYHLEHPILAKTANVLVQYAWGVPHIVSLNTVVTLLNA
jgi:hypothetical protein